MPALLKGLFDRVWLPGFAFRFRKNGMGWKKLLCHKTARIIILANTNPWVSRTLFGDFTNELSRATLGFAGIRCRNVVFSPSEKASENKKNRWCQCIERLGKRGS